MALRWVVDPEANATLWADLSRIPLRLVDGPGRVVDVGGGNGNFVAPLLANHARLVTVDVDRAALAARHRQIAGVVGSLLALPFRNGAFDAVAGRAVLHHVPEDLDRAIAEVARIVRPSGLVHFQEPTSGNRLASLARRRFPTERHDPHERPLPADAYVEAVRRHLDVIEVGHHFLLSYLIPHLVGRLPPNRRTFARALTRRLFAWDRRILAALPGLRPRAAYVSVLARRR